MKGLSPFFAEYSEETLDQIANGFETMGRWVFNPDYSATERAVIADIESTRLISQAISAITLEGTMTPETAQPPAVIAPAIVVSPFASVGPVALIDPDPLQRVMLSKQLISQKSAAGMAAMSAAS